MDASIERQPARFDGEAGLAELKALRDEIVMRTHEQKEWKEEKLLKERMKEDTIKAQVLKKKQLRMLKQLSQGLFSLSLPCSATRTRRRRRI